jgi:hypothetical protein
MRVALGFDGSNTDDFSAIRAETIDGWQFTPTYGPDRLPTIWDPARTGGQIPRLEVHAAVEQLFRDYDVVRMYCDPPLWSSEIEQWALQFGEKVVMDWETYRLKQMHAALDRFITDLQSGALTHDGCPITAQHIANARKVPKPGQRYLLGKPHGAYHQKIDAAMASVLAHEAAADVRATPEPVKAGLKRVRGRTAGY